MTNLNLNILINTPKENLVKDINQIFNSLLNEIQKYLGLDFINSDIALIIVDDIKEKTENFFDLGVRRRMEQKEKQIEISGKISDFLKIILLREAYLCFVPNELKEKEIIQIVIHEIIESDLSKLKEVNEWKALIRSMIINYDYLSSQFDKLDKFFKLEATEQTQSPTQFFFEFIRRNISLIRDKMEDFYDILYEEFIYKTSKSLYNDEIVETIRVLVKIFYQVKLFRKYSEFEEYFQEFKEKGIISTYLSKRKFSENLRWINKGTIISPSFQPLYYKLNIAVVILILKFNPIINPKHMYKILDRIPFLHNPAFVNNGFSEEIRCYFVIPMKYLKDLLKFVEKLNDFGYIINKECYLWKENNNILNLNYFREFSKDLRKIINPNHKDYDTEFEVICSAPYNEPQKEFNLTLLEWLIFERVAHTSATGFGFERRAEVLQSLKDELMNHIESERVLISNLRASLSNIYNSQELKKSILEFLKRNKRFGFFYMEDMLEQILTLLNLIERLIKQNPEIKNLTKLQEFLKIRKISQLIEDNMTFKSKEIQLILFRDFIPIFFNSNQEYIALKKKFNHFLNFFNSCRKLKIFSFDSMIEIIRNEKLTEKIYFTKEKKLRQSFEKIKPYKITNQELDSTFSKFLKIGLITPELINTITTSSFAKYHPFLLLKETSEANNQVEKIIKFFPRAFLYKVRNLFNEESYIMIFTYFLNINEKELFSSILYNLFKEDLISFKRYFTSGLSPFVLIKDFYDFDRKEFFYTSNLFEQSFLYIQKVLGDVQNPLKETKTISQKKFWSQEKGFLNLVKEVSKRISHELIDFRVNRINKLTEFNYDLNNILLEPDRFKSSQQAKFFKKYIKSIKFIPNFQTFGLNQFFLYIRPSNIDEIDFKHLLINSFQFIKYPTIIDDTNSFLIKYIFPYRNPNSKHLNWYTMTKRVIEEYCLFSIKKVIQILNFNYNLSANGWNYDSNRFKIYLQNILFNPDYRVEFSKVKEFNMENSSEPNFFGPSSEYFQALSAIYSWRSIDIKSFLGTRKYSIINNVTKLLSKNLIFPYISVRNLGFQDKIYLILPNINKKLNSKIIEIFKFFNYGFIYEIEGEFYIHGFNEVINFENGLMIKLNLPECELDDFLKLFKLLFEYLEINRYIILTDLTNGKNLLKGTYGNIDFLDNYNPLINLKWNDKDKIWMNHKLFTEKFEKIYPSLL